MAKKKKKHRTKKTEDVGQDSVYAPVRFNLEPDAEDIFLAAIENISAKSIAEKKRSHHETGKKTQQQKPKASPAETTIDLHGCTLDEAKQKIDSLFQQLLRHPGHKCRIRIITGKGIHSRTSGVLAAEVHGYVVARYQKYISEIQESPHSVKVGGIPIRGHFDLIFRS